LNHVIYFHGHNYFKKTRCYKLTLDKEQDFIHHHVAYHEERGIDKMERDTIQKTYRINRKDISYLKFLLESYEGIAVSRTLDDRIAIVELMIALGFYSTFQGLMKDVSGEMGMAPVLTSYLTRENHDVDKRYQPTA